ncbi:hypothetical protein F5887DRAFT_921517 [Amanita rubescens]|nr:hypothetical protein F5887DRAFT_921517 [Amanita rubescens]
MPPRETRKLSFIEEAFVVYAKKKIYLRAPPQLEKATQPNLEKRCGGARIRVTAIPRQRGSGEFGITELSVGSLSIQDDSLKAQAAQGLVQEVHGVKFEGGIGG